MGKRGFKKLYEKRLCVRVTEEELEYLQKKAEGKQLSMSRYLVESGLASNRILNSEEREILERAIFHVRKIGVNLNQIAKTLNRGGDIAGQELRNTLKQQSETLEELKKAILGG